MNNITEPIWILYIIARTDLYQLNPGKLAAQACHAQSLFSEEVSLSLNSSISEQRSISEQHRMWSNGLGFGTTIVLEATLNEMQEIADLSEYEDISSNLVVDPTYPFVNHYGEMFTAEETTCMYVFIDTKFNSETLNSLKSLALHR